MNVVITHY